MKPNRENAHSSIRNYTLLFALVWTLVLAALFNLNLQSELKNPAVPPEQRDRESPKCKEF